MAWPASMPHLTAIIGGMKCGSTTLFKTLAQHADVCPSRQKECNFFSSPRRWDKGWDWYRRQFPVKSHHRTLLDASPSYAKTHLHPEVPRRMARLPEVDIIYVLRDPIARIRSHIRHALWAPWGQRLVRQPERLFQGPLKTSDYARQLDAFAQQLDRDRIHVLTLDDLQRTPAATLRRIQQGIGVHPQSLPIRWENRAPATLWEARAVWPALHGAATRPRVRRALRTAAYNTKRVPGLRRLLFRRSDRLPLPAGWEDEARARLAPSMRRLRDRWGVDVRAWGF